jgi:hypothetical protein
MKASMQHTGVMEYWSAGVLGNKFGFYLFKNNFVRSIL